MTLATKDYRLVREWERWMGAFDYYVRDQVQRAKATDAPADALYELHDRGNPTGRWVTFAELSGDHPFRVFAEKAGLVAQD